MLPAQVRNDPKVIASYLGTDERAIVRSGESATGPVVPPGPGSSGSAGKAAVAAPLTAVSPAAPDGQAG